MLDRPASLSVAEKEQTVTLTYRRALFAILVMTTMAAVLWLASVAVPPYSFGGIAFLVLFAVTLPWSVMGFWNAVIGFLIMRLYRDPATAVNPLAASIRGDEPVTASTAILMCIRNESPDQVVRNLQPLMADLVQAKVAHLFHVYLLSDSSDPGIIAAEAALFESFIARWNGAIPVTYRRRTVNTAFKAGNIRDFCERWGHNHTFALSLDADSFMPAHAVLRLLRIMQANPTLGILQTLIIGMPSVSPFARLFQFGMRLGMRSYTLGASWWQGDCGPYWGHNAILRLGPFIAHCHLPSLSGNGPLAGPILSHDQVEAVLMRRAGYEVRVLPQEGLSWEENPPTLMEFTRRDLRWCQGNMQYWRLLTLPGLKPVSRFQLIFAIQMYLGSPAWMAMTAIGIVLLALSDTPSAPYVPVGIGAGTALFAIMMLMTFAPKITTMIDVLLRNPLRRSFGGTVAFILNVLCETLFMALLFPIIALSHTIFLFRLLVLRRAGTWTGQLRESHAVPWRLAFAKLWPQTLAGCIILAIVAVKAPADIGFALLGATGLILAMPFAVATASPVMGTLLARIGIGRIPEENAPRTSWSRCILRRSRRARRQRGRNLSPSMFDDLRTLRGIIRSLRIYYGNRQHGPAMDRLYRQFVRPGDLVFDIGAHVGDRVAAFRRLHARVVAVEPQPALVKTLRLLYGRDPDVAIEAAAVGRQSGSVELNLNIDNPTVSTASEDFIAAAADAPGWHGQAWSRRLRVPLMTVDALIARHGMPAFIKIDVEGFEAEVLAGLGQPVQALSFEFTLIQRDIARACIERCSALGYSQFNAALGESQALVHKDWVDAHAILGWLSELPSDANSGDVYARLG